LARQTHAAEGLNSALPLAHQAVENLIPAFHRRPSEHAELLRAIVAEYIELCRTANEIPDKKLLEPLVTHLAGRG
jgi:hypothetical protein